jgi:small-conductance mechanosensitive channel
MSFRHRCTSPNFLEMLAAYVVFPDPGGPSRITLGGLLGAVLLNLILSIFARSFPTTFT